MSLVEIKGMININELGQLIANKLGIDGQVFIESAHIFSDNIKLGAGSILNIEYSYYIDDGIPQGYKEDKNVQK